MPSPHVPHAAASGRRRPRRGDTLPALFADVVRRYPDAVAIVHDERRVTYRELDAVSDDYAAELEDLGVGPGRFVPVLMRRDPEFIAVLLAILKRGAAYAALDREWPTERLAGQITHLDPPLLITDRDGAWPVPTWQPGPIAGVAGGRRPTPVAVGPDDPCSVLYTSGSSGEPKAVVSVHGGTARLYDDCDFLPLGRGAVMPQLAPVQWDGFSLDCWSVLLTGGTSVFVDDDVLLPARLRELIERQHVNIAFLTTRLFNMLVDEDLDAFDGLDTVLVGGERVSPTHLRRFLDARPGTLLSNMYGPAECSVVVTARTVTAADCDDPGGVPLGRELVDTEVWILDGDRPCAAGEIGEICLGGRGLAAGYAGAPELTAQRFVAVELQGTPRRLYRTGDLGHRTSDGVLYFDGRTDRQVKIRGHRIEPGELERAATTVPGVRDTAVLPTVNHRGECDGLALFYTSPGLTAVEPDDLRARLAATLPEHLVPGRVHRLDRLPVLAVGKIDLRALADLLGAPPVPGPGGADACRTATEQAVAAVFAAVLDVPSVPRDASLVELGGSSIDAARVCVRLETELGVPVQISQLCRTPAVGTLAAWLDVVRASEEAPVAVDVTADRIPLTAMQSLLFMTPVRDTAAWWVDGPLSVPALTAALADMHRRHQALHARYRVSDDEPVAELPDDPGVPELVVLPDGPDDESCRAALVLVMGARYDVTAGRIWRCVVVHSNGSGRSAFGIGVHHAAFDGWSKGLLLRELAVAYRARLAGTAPVFAGPAGGLADAAADHARRMRLVDIEAQHAFWAQELGDLPMLQVPGRSTPGPLLGPAGCHLLPLTAVELGRWDTHAASLGMTRFAALLTGFGAALRAVTGEPDFGVLVPVARRGSRQLDATVTCRMDYVCLRLREPDGDAFALVKDAVGRAFAAQDVSYSDVVTEIAAAGAGMGLLGLMPMFLLHDNVIEPLELAGCDTEEIAYIDIDDGLMSELGVEVHLHADGGATIRVLFRQDILPADVVGALADELSSTLRAGPTAVTGAARAAVRR